MNIVSKDDFYLNTELIKSSNTLLVYANSLLGHFDKNATLGDIVKTLANTESNILTDTMFCSITTSEPCRLIDCETIDNYSHYFMDCTFLELVSVFTAKKVKYSLETKQVPNELLSVIMQYGVYNKVSFAKLSNLSIDDRIDSIKIVFKDVKSYNLDDINDFLSHLNFID